MARLLIVVAVAANVSVAGMSVTASAWLWTRAAEPITSPEIAPAVPSIVGETSVPYRRAPAVTPAQARRRAARARRATRTAVARRVRSLTAPPVTRRVFSSSPTQSQGGAAPAAPRTTPRATPKPSKKPAARPKPSPKP
jgi:hypothetical protein